MSRLVPTEVTLAPPRRGSGEDREILRCSVPAGGNGASIDHRELATVALVTNNRVAPTEFHAFLQTGLFKDPVVGPVHLIRAAAVRDPIPKSVEATAQKSHTG